ncbi:MAG: hypothetical protein HON14_13910 [Rhodospirillaceae bacterium]|jgi:O-antigen ligase|nr:hypothetical protein [Rhodospirillaceae bacterium]MBT4588077.1 hypothetical protein [Rhodospirillaceae bacterium]MBT4940223.1 hypothetical protein [Rhodospirillaceae bacterium]MBT5938945.1 hypothetical protein [Rhodospirillaceae bacterium]MBT7266675.1 hypothetical protein [Rhodospirillaceae bacterium]
MLNELDQIESGSKAAGTSFAIVAFLMIPIAVFSSKAMAPLFILLALVLLGHRVIKRNFSFSLPLTSILAFLCLLIWAGLSQFWTFDTALGAKLLLPLLALFALGIFLHQETRSISSSTSDDIGRFLIAGAGLAIVVLFFESVTGNWLTRLGRGLAWHDVIRDYTGGINIAAFVKNGVVILSILIWPVLSTLWRRQQKIWAGLFLLSTAYLIYRFSASTAIIALIASAIGIAIACLRRKIAVHLIAGSFVVFVLAMPFGIEKVLGDKTTNEIGQIGFDAKLPNSAINRFIIWHFSTKRIFEKPATGWGMNAARQIPGGSDKYSLRVKNSNGKEFTLFREFFVPLHTHNQAIQIWLELGAIGALLVAGFGWLFIRRLENENIDPSLFGVVISILVFNLLSFGAWQSWWIATQFLCISLAISATRKQS